MKPERLANEQPSMKARASIWCRCIVPCFALLCQTEVFHNSDLADPLVLTTRRRARKHCYNIRLFLPYHFSGSRVFSLEGGMSDTRNQPIGPYKLQPLPLGRHTAVYYRQSSEWQIGNISTTLQTVDMIEHLLGQGLVRNFVFMIDMDHG